MVLFIQISSFYLYFVNSPIYKFDEYSSDIKVLKAFYFKIYFSIFKGVLMGITGVLKKMSINFICLLISFINKKLEKN